MTDLQDYEWYEEDSWDLWDSTVLSQIHRTASREDADRGAYLPSPQEIEERKCVLSWLQMNGFPNRFIFAIMAQEHPHISLVVRLTYKHGPHEARRRLEPFLMKNYYTKYRDE